MVINNVKIITKYEIQDKNIQYKYHTIFSSTIRFNKLTNIY